MSSDDAFAAVASAILERVADAIGCPTRVVSHRQRELADDLEINVTDCPSSWSAFVRIQEAIQLSNLDAVRRVGLKPRDIVFEPDDRTEECLMEALGERWGSIAEESLREYEVPRIREDVQVSFNGSTGLAPARYLEKRAAPEGTEQPDVPADQQNVR